MSQPLDMSSLGTCSASFLWRPFFFDETLQLHLWHLFLWRAVCRNLCFYSGAVLVKLFLVSRFSRVAWFHTFLFLAIFRDATQRTALSFLDLSRQVFAEGSEYRTTLEDGTMISGWDTGLAGMRPGDRAIIRYIPTQSALRV